MLDSPIFEPFERETFKDNQYLHPYAGITKAQLFGLLAALGEYVDREEMAPSALEAVADESELAETHRAMVRFHEYRAGMSLLFPSTAPLRVAFDGVQVPQVATDDSQFVFDASERGDVRSADKYVNGYEDLTKRHLVGFLEDLGRYSLSASKLAPVSFVLSGPARKVHAHNALIRFRDQPFTLNEFRNGVREAMNKL